MISQDTAYHAGSRALVFMILRKLKTPLTLVVVMAVITFLLSWQKVGLVAWQTGSSHILQQVSVGLYNIEKYGWIFTILLAFFFALTAVPEYFGLTIRLGENALYVRSGVLSHREIAIPYRQIQTMNIIEHMPSSMFGLCELVIVTSAYDENPGVGADAQAALELVHTSLARDLQTEIFARLGNPPTVVAAQ